MISEETSRQITRELFTVAGEIPRAELDRAELLEDLVRVVYDHIKEWVPGDGPDGKDSEERMAAGGVLAAAVSHADWARARAIRPPDQTPPVLRLVEPGE